MVASKDLEEFLTKYDLYHSYTLLDKKVAIDISFNDVVKIILTSDKETQEFNFSYDTYFKEFLFPRIILHILSKNNYIIQSKDKEKVILESKNKKELVTINNASHTEIKLIETLLKSLEIERLDNKEDIYLKGPDYKYTRFIIYGIAEEYAIYRKDFFDDTGKIDFFNFYSSKSYLNENNRYGEKNLKNLIILEIARNVLALSYYMPINDDIFSYLEKELKEDALVSDICEKYRKANLSNNNIYTKALRCAEFEELNSAIIVNNKDVVLEAITAIKNGITYNDVNYEKYYKNKEKYYELIGDLKLKDITIDFLKNKTLSNEESDSLMAKDKILDEFRRIKRESNMKKDENKILLDAIKERDEIKKNAEEFAKLILQKQQENQEIIKAAEEQARRIIELERENEELKRMAEENAKYIFEHENDDNPINDRIDIKDLIKKIDEKLKELRENRPSNNKYIVSSEEENELVRAAEEYAKLIYDKQNELDEIKKAADESAKKIIELEKENEELKRMAEENAKFIYDQEKIELKKDADDFARIIFNKQEERKVLVKAAEEQARRIIDLEKENEELKRLARENAESIFARENRYFEELKLREEIDNTPIAKGDIDKLLNLLNALTSVEQLEFAINHPTVMQELNDLEEKINTYLIVHKNVQEEEKKETPTIKKDTTTLPVENIETIRNAYIESMAYTREGRHTVIYIEEVDNKYKVTLFSVKNDMDDILTEVFFENEFFDENVIKDICEIFKKDSVIVASKIDNIPNGYQDYLVIDNLENALKFMGVKKEIVEIAKKYC